jgi:hypothetical protein
MKKSMILNLMLAGVLLVPAMTLLGQARPYEGPDDPEGDRAAIRKGYMEGNRVRLQFRNTTELSDWGTGTDPYASKWPNTNKGTKMSDGVALMIASRVYLENDTIPVDDIQRIRTWDMPSQGRLDTLYFLQTCYREEMDRNEAGDVMYGLYPVFGYFNENGIKETPAISNDPDSWPPLGWPAKGGLMYGPAEDGSRFFHGRFGIGSEEQPSAADLECYFVANDAQDMEYFEDDLPAAYYPRPGLRIGDKLPSVTINKGKPWGGVGIRVEQRGYQWLNPEVQDAIFWEYNIANTSEYSLNECAFGYWVDNAIGGDGTDEIGAFDKLIDMAYSWDINGVGEQSKKTGTMGFAFLESPGIFDDGIDNDDDGLTDERRDMPLGWADPAGSLVPADYHITDMNKFLTFYNLKTSDLREHWQGDEDGDWDSFDDSNGNGRLDEGENPGDDVGVDGLGPGELGYELIGPDEGEGDGKPSYVAGRGCEPDFNAMDISESDMLGLTMFQMWPINEASKYLGDHSGKQWFYGDKSMFDIMTSGQLELFMDITSNLVECFASGIFPLMRGQTERISMSELHSYDPLEGLSSESHLAPALFKLKQIVQIIYERDYRFASAPLTPTLKATPGDGKVILTWDDVADKFTREAFLNNINDFEGYKLYKTTDKLMTEAMRVTDGRGNPVLGVPVFECDLKDGLTDYTTFGSVSESGYGYFLGNDTGLEHYYIDTEVQNGVTYYYGISAYDFGIHPDSLYKDASADKYQRRTGISPSFTSIKPELDENENIVSIPKSMAVVTPGYNPAGYRLEADDATQVEESRTLVRGTGSILAEVMMPGDLVPGAVYSVEFSNYVIKKKEKKYTYYGVKYTTDGVLVYREKDGQRAIAFDDTLIVNQDKESVPKNYTTVLRDGRTDANIKSWYVSPEGAATALFDGIRLQIRSGAAVPVYDERNSGWYPEKNPDIPLSIVIHPDEYQCYAWDYDIRWLRDDEPRYVTRTTTGMIRKPDSTAINKSLLLAKQEFPFIIENQNHVDSTRFTVNGTDTTYLPEILDVVAVDTNRSGAFEIREDLILVGPILADGKWAGTVFVMDFSAIPAENLPQPNDVYHVRFNRPFFATDKFVFRIQADAGVADEDVRNDMDRIKVVPNPYVATNIMEPALENPDLNQRRRLMFTHIPERCTVRIYTVSGVLVDEIRAPEDGLVTWGGVGQTTGGIIHWDLKSKEGLDVAAGVYLFHVKDEATGLEKIGKFAVIK